MGIQRLAQGDYQLQLKETGLYKNIYNNLNRLAQTLSSNVKQRNLVEKKREEWISNITHDIKTPLASITGYAEILLDADYQFTDEERKNNSNPWSATRTAGIGGHSEKSF